MTTTQAITAALGGTKSLGRRIRNATELAALVRQGLPPAAMVALLDRLSLRADGASRTLGIAPRTLTRRLHSPARLSAAESDRTVRLARVFTVATAMIGDEAKAVEWLRTPNRALGGAIPLDHLDTDLGTREVENVLGRIAHGVYS